ncbi:hypothetical protein ABW20_dc0109512 [Dactylellina cionopaga]|nr:hypothetical protein ABW20_dc0109512 [Dactylellina cionopaga]
MASIMETDGTPAKKLKRSRSPSEEPPSTFTPTTNTSINTTANTSLTNSEIKTQPFPYSSSSSPLDLGLPECLVSPAKKRQALASPTDENAPSRRITRHAATVAAVDSSLRDPFEYLPDNVVRMIIFLLPNKSIVGLRRVSRFWKGNVEYVISKAVVERLYAGRTVTEKLKQEGKLGWPEFAFRKNTFLEEARSNGAPTSVKKFTNAQLWELVGDRLVWVDDSANLNVQHLSAWDVNDRKDSLVALAGNPRAFSKNKFLHNVIADEKRKASGERPKRASKKEKIPEAIIIRWSLRDTLKNRRTKIKVNFLVPFGTTHIMLDYFQCEDPPSNSIERWHRDLYTQSNSRNKLACINIITGYADWNVSLDDFRLAFPPAHGVYLRPRYQYGSSSYLIHGDKAYSFTSPDRRFMLGPQIGDRKISLTVRDCKTGALVANTPMAKISSNMSEHHYTQPEHSLISPDGKFIVLSMSRSLWICNAETYAFIEKIDLTWLQYSIVGSRYDLEFNEDGSRLYLTEECNGLDFNVLELDCHNKFKPVFIRSYHVPSKTNFVSRTCFNHKLHTQVLATRNPSQPMSGEWRPEIIKFVSMDELMEGIPRDLWAAEWKTKLSHLKPEKWTWGGPDTTTLYQNHPINASSALLATLPPAQLQALGMATNSTAVVDDSGLTPRGRIFLETPRKDYVMFSKNPITLPPLTKVQPNAIQEPADEASGQGEWRSGGVYYTGPSAPKRRGKKAPPKKTVSKVEEGKMNERREWWIGGRMTPFKIKNGERFIMFDQDDTVYCCDFGPVGW